MAFNLLPFPFLLIPGSGCTWLGSWLPVRKPKPSCIGSAQTTCKQQPTTQRDTYWGMVCPRRVDPEKKPTPILKVGLGQLGREFWSSDYLEHVLEEGWGLNGHIPLVSWTPCPLKSVTALGGAERSPRQVIPCQSPRTLLLNGHFGGQPQVSCWKYL